MAEAVFCQITGRDISTGMCIDLQYSHEPEACFGCGACSRLCAKCHKYKPVNPEIGLCCTCIGKQLGIEQRFDRKGFKTSCSKTVLCQIVKKTIASEMCLLSQGEIRCSQCTAHTRLCEQCVKRKVYFYQYGLCLHCALKKYAPVWLKISDAELNRFTKLVCDPHNDSGLLERVRDFAINSQVISFSEVQYEFHLSQPKAQAILDLLEREKTIKKQRDGARVIWVSQISVPILSTRQIAPLGKCSHCGNSAAPLRICEQQFCLLCVRELYPRKWGLAFHQSLTRKKVFEDLVTEAKELTDSYRYVTVKAIEEHFACGYVLAARIISQLAKEGVVSRKAVRIHGRRVSHNKKRIEQAITTLKKRISQLSSGNLCAKCGDREARLVLCYQSSCVYCARKIFKTQWAKWTGHATQEQQEAIICELCLEMVQVLEKISILSVRQLTSLFLIGRGTASQIMEQLIYLGVVERDFRKGVIVGFEVLNNTNQDANCRILTSQPLRKDEDENSFLTPSPVNRQTLLGLEDELYGPATLIVIEKQKVTTMFLAKQFKIGLERAGRLIRAMEHEGIIIASAAKRRSEQIAGRSPILVTSPRAKNRIGELERLISIIGNGKTKTFLKDVLRDLRALERIRSQETS